MSLGYADTALTTTYNAGTYDETNLSFSPYAVYSPIEGLRISGIIGYSLGSQDVERGAGITGSTDTGMWFGAANAAYKFAPKKDIPLDLTVQMGMLASRKKTDAYVESDATAVGASTSNTRQLKSGLEAAYSLNVNALFVQPFARGGYTYDFTDPTNGDSDAYTLGGGVRVGSVANGLNGSIEGETEVGRSDYSEHTISGLIAYGFSLDGDAQSDSGLLEPYVKSSFSQDAMRVGTGLKYMHGQFPISAHLDMTQVLPDGDGDGAYLAKISAEINF